ncbi:phage baseplate assembly protein V [Nodularia sp. NIES-3585]|uniref:phage baseplate assembly protein V n=1 Tax=Nodularia sp. NIES-3585 TaxID=1973477 RepID=UPI0020CBB90A|nr:phage baseplate assembly protein V [Nodularia sp. NIES-3585]
MSNNQNNHLSGVFIGLVTNNKDPDGLGRVKVKFPWLSDTEESYWARVVTLMAGNNQGIYFLPEVNDEVLVAFEQGNMAFPFILGALWNGKDKPPGKNDDGKNNQRIIKSRSGHQIILDDTDGEEQILIQDKTGKNQIVINSQDNKMDIKVEKDFTIEAKGKIILKSSDDLAIECNNLSIKTKQNYQLEAGANCTIDAKAKYQLDAQSGLGIKCSAGVKINDDSLEVM